jgi:hypothetical protein
MAKNNITAADVAKLAIAVVRAKGGDFTGLAMQASKWVKPIIAIVGGLIIIVALFISLPFVLLGRAINLEANAEHGDFFATEIANADFFAADFARKEEQRFKRAEQQAKNSVSLDQHSTWDSVFEVDINFPTDDLLIIYTVMFEEYDGESIDFSKLEFLEEDVIVRTELFSATTSIATDDDGNEYTITHYLFTYTARLKPFTEILNVLELDEIQREHAIIMYTFLYDQDQFGTDGNDFGGFDLGSITYTDGAVDVVYYSQYDNRWKDTAYGRTGTIGRSGCGPTALAIAISSLSDRTVLPTAVASWAALNGYYIEGAGSLHALIPDGARHWGVPAIGVGYDWQAVVNALADGKLVIAIMGKGHFTSSGHFIVLRGVTADGKIMVADPASLKRSEQLWDASIITSESRKGASAGGAFWVLG